MNRLIKILFVFLIAFFSCKDKMDFSPYVINFTNENRNVNQRNIELLNVLKNDDTITIALTGDSHNFFDETEKFVNKANQLANIDLVVHVGDLADFGLPKQYIWANSFLLRLNVPYFVVVGNHDLVGNGAEAYQEMFGPFNFSFIFDSVKFIFINTNSREFEFNGKVPDNNWLEEELKPNESFNKSVIIFHVPPMDPDFDVSLEESFRNKLSEHNNVLLCIHGHLHGHTIYMPYNDSITYVNVYGVENNKFNIIKIINNQFIVEEVSF